MQDETDYYAWKVGLAELTYIHNIIEPGEGTKQLQSYIRSLIKDIVRSVGFKTHQSVNKGLLQVLLIDTACKYGDKEIINKANTTYRLLTIFPVSV